QCAMLPIRDETVIVNPRMVYPSSTVWLFLTIEFFVSTFLSAFLTALTVIKSLLPKPPRDLTGDVVLIAGASSSLGESLTEEFVKSGCSVVCLDNDCTVLEETASRLRKQYPSIEEVKPTHRKDDSTPCCSAISVHECNLLDKNEIRRVAQKVKEDIGKIDVLVTCVGSPDQDIFDTASRTLMSHFWTVLAFLPMMMYRERAHVVGVTPVASNNDAFHSSRVAIISLMENLCQELSNHSNHLTFLTFSPTAECSTMKESEIQVAKNIVRAIKTDQCNVNVSWISRLLYHIRYYKING
ncbi:Retinol dehydrogenase 10, partial [Eufriesea mexicana]